MAEFIGLDTAQKEKVLRGVERLRSEERVEVLSQALMDTDIEIRLQAVDSIEKLSLEALYPNLLWSVRKPKDQLRNIVKTCFLNIPRETFHKVVSRELGSVVVPIRTLALELMSERGDVQDFVRILPLLFDYKIDVRDKARKSLAHVFMRTLEKHQERINSLQDTVEGKEEARELGRAVEWLFRFLEGPDLITASTAAEILIDYGQMEQGAFWRRHQSLSLKGREVLVRLFLKREDVPTLRVLFSGLLQEDSRAADKCSRLLSRMLPRMGPTPFLEVLHEFTDDDQARLARKMAEGELLRDLLQRFEVTPQRLRGTLFDLMEHVDYRAYVPFLENCLKQGDDQLIFRALQLLIPLEQRNYVSDFIPLLGRDNPEVLLLVLEYLRRRGDISIFPSISPLLTHPDERVTRAVVSTVFALSRTHLLSRYRDLTPQVRQEIVNLLSRLDASFVETLCGDITRLSSVEKVHLVNILEILGQDSKIQDTLLKFSKESDQRVRATVAKAVQVLSEARQKLELTHAFLRDEDARVRANAIESLESVEDEEILERLIRLTRSPNSRERANAIKKLWDLGYRDFEISLIQMTEEPDEWTRASAVWVLGEIEAPHLADIIYEKMQDKSPVVRENAIRALGKQGTLDQVRNLTDYLEDPDQRVREAARDVIRKRLRLSYEIR